jgi:hypothetical protein
LFLANFLSKASAHLFQKGSQLSSTKLRSAKINSPQLN